jgi:hypothetical protein
LAGIVTCTVGVIVNLPKPVFSAALKNLTAVGAGAPAGNPSGYVTKLLGFVQDEPLLQAEATLAIVEELVGNVLGVAPPVENCVEVTVRFQPKPEPRESVTVSGSVYVAVWSVPFNVAEKLGAAEVASVNAPAASVAVTGAVSAHARAPSNAPAASTTTTTARTRLLLIIAPSIDYANARSRPSEQQTMKTSARRSLFQ